MLRPVRDEQVEAQRVRRLEAIAHRRGFRGCVEHSSSATHIAVLVPVLVRDAQQRVCSLLVRGRAEHEGLARHAVLVHLELFSLKCSFFSFFSFSVAFNLRFPNPAAVVAFTRALAALARALPAARPRGCSRLTPRALRTESPRVRSCGRARAFSLGSFHLHEAVFSGTFQALSLGHALPERQIFLGRLTTFAFIHEVAHVFSSIHSPFHEHVLRAFHAALVPESCAFT